MAGLPQGPSWPAGQLQGSGRAQCTKPVSPWQLLDGAIAVYTVSSQLGFEAMLAGHRPRVFGQPFYSGWGLSDDEYPVDRRTPADAHPRATLCRRDDAAPDLVRPFPRPALCDLETVIDGLEARLRAFREDRTRL